MYRKNLYFGVRKPFVVYVRTGTVPSNFWSGRLQAMDYTYREEETRIGEDEIHYLVGGLFLIRDGEPWEIDLFKFNAVRDLPMPARRTEDEIIKYEKHLILLDGDHAPISNYRLHDALA